MATVNVGGTKQYIFIGTGSDLLPSDGVNHSYSMLVLLDNGASATKTAEILAGEHRLVNRRDEKVTAFPAVAGDIVFFTTTIYPPSTPCTPYSVEPLRDDVYRRSGLRHQQRWLAEYWILQWWWRQEERGGSTSADSTKVFSVAGARATSPFIVDQHLVFSAGDKLEMFGDPNDFNNGVGQAGVRILSWRLVR